MSPSDYAEVKRLTQEGIDRALREQLPRSFAQFQSRLALVERSTNTIEFQSLAEGYKKYNATAISQVLPYGTFAVVDTGTTPTRLIALYMSVGDKYVEVFTKTI